MLKIIEQSYGMPIDVELLKSCCGIPAKVSKYDQDLIQAVRHATVCIEKYTRRTIMTTTYEWTHGNTVIYLPMPKIQHVISVSCDGVLLAESEYRLYKVLETTVVVLTDKYIGKMNTVKYQAGFGESADTVPVVLSKIIFDCARFLFEYPGKFDALYAYYKGELSHSAADDQIIGMKKGQSRKLYLTANELSNILHINEYAMSKRS